MGMMAATAMLLFVVGYASGYFARAALSWIRRSRMRKQRADKKAEAMLKQEVMAPQASAPAMSQEPSPMSAGIARTASA